MMDCCDMRGPQDPRSSSQVATHSGMVRLPLFCTQPNVPRACDVIWLECVGVCVSLCVCVPLFFCMSVSPAEKPDQALRISSVTAHQD